VTRRARPSSSRPCVFLDRDGTVAREAGYINHPDRIELLPGAAAAIRRLNRRGVLAILATNQAGIARGYLTEAVLRKIHARLEQLLAEREARLDAIYYSPYHREGKITKYRRDDGGRKPGIGMIERARRRFDIDMSRSYVVGDKISDVEMARRAGLKGVFVLSGYGLGEYCYQRKGWKVKPDYVGEDLREAVGWILRDLRGRAVERRRS
jgi:D-glycero-D-manno-heptose 1,7-bisphosphate phosphatase